jgi:hypothetical protein
VTTGETTISEARVSSTPAAAIDIALCAAVVAAAVAIGWIATSAGFGGIPAQNALYDADTGRVLGNLTGDTDSYYRFKVHPWHGWICILYQFIGARLLGLTPEIGIPALCVLIAATCVGLLYLVLRRVGVGPLASASYALLFCSTAGFVFWSALPECHMAGGVSTLAAVLLMTGKPRTASDAFWRSVLALAVGFSMVITNGMLWVLRQIEFEQLRAGFRPFFAANLARFGSLRRQVAYGVALVFLVWAPQWLFLHKRIGIPFNILEERHYIELGTHSWNWSMHVLGLTPPVSALSLVLSIACLAVPIASLRVLKPQLWFIPLFPLFGVVLHSFYGSESAFLFSPNYLPLLVVSLALLAKECLPKWFPAAMLPAAALLLAFNLQQWHGELNTLKQAGQIKTYAAAVHY